MFENLKYPKNIPSGTGEVIYVALQNWFETIEKPSGSLIALSHIFLSGKGFLKIQCAPQKNKVEAKSTGELGLNNYQYQLQSVIAGSYIEQHSLMKALMNKQLIVMVPDNNDSSMFYQIGSEDAPAYIKPEFSTGTTSSGIKGYTLDSLSTTNGATIYQGSVVLSPDQVGDMLSLMVDDINYLINELDENIETA